MDSLSLLCPENEIGRFAKEDMQYQEQKVQIERLILQSGRKLKLSKSLYVLYESEVSTCFLN